MSEMERNNWFEQIWAQYPRRLGKKAAERHFRATVKSEADFERIKRALQNYVKKLEADRTEEQFVKHGSSWFNSWEDWTDYAPPRASNAPRVPVPVKRAPDIEPTEEERQEALAFLKSLREGMMRSSIQKKIKESCKCPACQELAA